MLSLYPWWSFPIGLALLLLADLLHFFYVIRDKERSSARASLGRVPSLLHPLEQAFRGTKLTSLSLSLINIGVFLATTNYSN